MEQAVILGDPTHFRIRSGANPHTRDWLGRRKKVDLPKAVAQWLQLKSVLESHGVRVHVVPPDPELPGLVFPANAGFRHGDAFYLSNLSPGRAGERENYRQTLGQLGFSVQDLPSPDPFEKPFRFEGEADFIPVGDPSGDPAKTVYLFTCGRIERQRWALWFGIPPYRRVYGFRSDRRALPALKSIVQPRQVFPLELVDEHHYHGDTVLCAFGPSREYLLVYLDGLSQDSQALLRRRFGERLVPLGGVDGRNFAANSFQISTHRGGQRAWVLLMPDGLTGALYKKVRSSGVIPCPIDVSEFLEKGGGAIKCMLLDLGEP